MDSEIRDEQWGGEGEGSLTALLARTLIFGRGMKPVRSARATTPIGQTECGSYPSTESNHQLKIHAYRKKGKRNESENKKKNKKEEKKP